MSEKPDELGVTQELKPITGADVLEVFGHFQENLFKRIDERDQNILTLIQKISSDMLAEYTRLAAQGHDHSMRLEKAEAAIEALKKQLNDLSSEVTKLKSGRVANSPESRV